MDPTPGKMISVEITASPTTAAGRKTLTRLCRRDAGVARRQRAQKQRRPSWQSWRRGGRQWHHQMKSQPPIKLAPGSRYAMLATVDVLRDLAAVQRWVKVTPA